MASERDHQRYRAAKRMQEQQGLPLATIARRLEPPTTATALAVSMSRVRSDLRAGIKPPRGPAREPEPPVPGLVEVALTPQQLAILLHTVQRVQSDHEVLTYVAPTLGYRQDLARAARALEQGAQQLRGLATGTCP